MLRGIRLYHVKAVFDSFATLTDEAVDAPAAAEQTTAVKKVGFEVPTDSMSAALGDAEESFAYGEAHARMRSEFLANPDWIVFNDIYSRSLVIYVNRFCKCVRIESAHLCCLENGYREKVSPQPPG